MVLMGFGILFLIGGVMVLVKPTYHDDQQFVRELKEGKVKTGDKIEFEVKDLVKDTILADLVIHGTQNNVVYLFENPAYVEIGKTYKYPILSVEQVMGVWIVTVDNEEQ